MQLADEQVQLTGPLALGRPFKLSLRDADYRAAASTVSRLAGRARSIRSSQLDSYASSARLRVALFMGLLLVLIGVGAALAVRALTHTLQTFSDGIRAVAAGRFDQRLPVRGNDEFSQFGAVFNDMSSQLEQRIDELDAERRRVQEFGQRFGAALAATHDVAGLLEIVVDSAVQLARAPTARGCWSPTRAPTCSSSSCGAASWAQRRASSTSPCATARASRAAPCRRARP